jgi:SWIM zinc finger
MKINKIKAAAEIAKSRTSDKRWVAAIDKAVAGVESGWWIITELADGIMVTTECGATYHANGSCQCRAFELGQPCKHRALARLVEIASELKETAPVAVSVEQDVAATPRKQLIVEIKAAWPKTWPPMADELVRRFRVNTLDYLADDMLKAVRLAIAA